MKLPFQTLKSVSPLLYYILWVVIVVATFKWLRENKSFTNHVRKFL